MRKTQDLRTCASHKPLGLSECVDVDFTFYHHLLCHLVYITSRTIIHHCIRKHKIHIPLELKRTRDDTIFDPRLDSLEVHRSFDNLVVVWRFRVFDRVVEDVAVAVLRYLAVEHSDYGLETLVGDGRWNLLERCGLDALCTAASGG